MEKGAKEGESALVFTLNQAASKLGKKSYVKDLFKKLETS